MLAEARERAELDAAERDEEDAAVEAYLEALGGSDSTGISG